jgi:hypothetical protein
MSHDLVCHHFLFLVRHVPRPHPLTHAPRLRPQLAFTNTNAQPSPHSHSLAIQLLSLTFLWVPVSPPASITRRSMVAAGIIRCGMLPCRGITAAPLCWLP